jgi:hypothetical protein
MGEGREGEGEDLVGMPLQLAKLQLPCNAAAPCHLQAMTAAAPIQHTRAANCRPRSRIV